MTVFERIHNELEKKGMIRADLVRLTGISEATIRNWKITEPKASVLYQVAQALDLTVEYLLTGEEPKKPEGPILTSEEKNILQMYRCLGWQNRVLAAKILQDMNEVEKKSDL